VNASFLMRRISAESILAKPKHQQPSIPQLPVVKHASQRRLFCLHKEIDLLLQVNDCLIM